MFVIGGLFIDVLIMFKNRGVKNLKLMCLVGVLEGIEVI